MNRSDDQWLDARQLYRDLAIPEFHQSFGDWFALRVQGDYQINRDWKVEGQGEEERFLIRPEVAMRIAEEEIGMPISRTCKGKRDAMRDKGFSEYAVEQEYAITDDDDLA